MGEALEKMNGSTKMEGSLMLSTIGRILKNQCNSDVELEMVASLSPPIDEDRSKGMNYDYFTLHSFGVLEGIMLDAND